MSFFNLFGIEQTCLNTIESSPNNSTWFVPCPRAYSISFFPKFHGKGISLLVTVLEPFHLGCNMPSFSYVKNPGGSRSLVKGCEGGPSSQWKSICYPCHCGCIHEMSLHHCSYIHHYDIVYKVFFFSLNLYSHPSCHNQFIDNVKKFQFQFIWFGNFFSKLWNLLIDGIC